MKVYVDIETTGLNPKIDHIHQLSLRCEGQVFNWYIQYDVKPSHDMPIPEIPYRLTLKAALSGFGAVIHRLAMNAQISSKEKLIFVGKNPYFDYSFLYQHIAFQETFHTYFHYNIFDIGGIINFLKDLGKIPKRQSSKLEDLVPYFGIELKLDKPYYPGMNIEKEYQPHNAMWDVDATEAVYQKCINLMKSF